VTILGAERMRFYSWQGQRLFFFATASKPALVPTQYPIQWIPGAVSPKTKRPDSEADQSPSSAEGTRGNVPLVFPHDVVFM